MKEVMRPDRLIWLGMLTLGLSLPAWPQDRAASEAELGWTDSTLQVIDPLRSSLLAGVRDGTDRLHGRQHMAAFLDAWRRLLSGEGELTGPLHILHFGGSHVQAGRIGWAFRKALQGDRPGVIATRGVVPPHRLVGENGPPETRWSSAASWFGQRSAHRRHQGHWGLTGIEATSMTPDTIRLWCSALEDCPDDVSILTRPEESNLWQVADTKQTKAGDTLILIPPVSEKAHFHGVQFHHDKADVVYHDLGGNGASTAAWLRHPHLVDQLRSTGADLAILAWGINDAHMAPERFNPDRFKARYAQLIDSVRAANPVVDILLVTNNDSHYRRRHNPNAEKVRKAMLELVSEKHVACWDLYHALGGAHSIDALCDAGFAASDRLHFNRNGYILIGELLYMVLTRNALSPVTP